MEKIYKITVRFHLKGDGIKAELQYLDDKPIVDINELEAFVSEYVLLNENYEGFVMIRDRIMEKYLTGKFVSFYEHCYDQGHIIIPSNSISFIKIEFEEIDDFDQCGFDRKSVYKLDQFLDRIYFS